MSACRRLARQEEEPHGAQQPDAVRAGSTSAILKAAEDAGFVVTLRDAEHLEEEPLASEYVEADLKISVS